jgi:serine/threonine protein kinase/tetratricopeptide (TPR) repeat protein
MKPAPRQIESILAAAVEVDSEEERRAFLEQACAGDAELKRRIEELIENHFRAGSFLEQPAVAPPATGEPPCNDPPTSDSRPDEGPGTRIGPYKLLQQIGEGGMGIVYMAEQEHPVRRRVALKIIKPGMDSAQVIARFEAERQALALMDHQNIAKVFDAGTTETGRPYFVMELVHGVPITQFCDANQLTPRERLGLCVPVCQAVQHAHQKGIIHRDIKPSNVLVTLYDDKPVPKVIDFGVAKAIEQRLTEKTLFTQFGALVGTFEYMSPEQADMNALGVDTRSDIYSLGVLLYELLTGTTPLERERLREAALNELVRLIKEEEPPRPSVRLSSSNNLPKIAAARKTEPAKLSKLVRGEIDWIVMKCLEKDRSRRYETANGLARDVERFLHDEPVEACPPTLFQRAAKWGRRHPAVVWATMLLLAVTMVASGIATFLIARERDLNKANYERAQANLDLAYRILDKIYMDTAEKRLPQEKDLTAEDRQYLENTLTFFEEIAKQNSNDRRARLEKAAAYRRVGGIHEQLGQDEQAAAAYQQALDISRTIATDFPEDPDCRRNLARSYSSLGGTKVSFLKWSSVRIPEVEQAYFEALRLQEQLVHEFPANLEGKHDLGLTYFRLGYIQLFRLGRPPAAAEEAVRQALKIREDLVAARPSEFLYRQELGMSLGNLGNLLIGTRKFPEAEKVVRRELEVRQHLVDDFPAEPIARHYLADAFMDLTILQNSTGKLREAVEARRQELRLRKKLATEFPNFMLFQVQLAAHSRELGEELRNTGAQDDAIAAYEQAIAACKEVVRLRPDVAFGYLCWRRALARLGDREEAVAAWEQAVARGAENAELANQIAWSLATAPEPPIRNPEKAVQLAKEALALQPQNGGFWNTLGVASYRTAQWKDAVAALERSMPLRSGGDSFDWFFLAMAHWQLGNAKEARHYYDRAVEWMEQNKPQDEELREDLRRFRAEAATLLGIQEEAPNK